jgi:hypothetical protein
LGSAHGDPRGADSGAEIVALAEDGRGVGMGLVGVRCVGEVGVGEEAREEARDERLGGRERGTDYARVDFDGRPGGGADVVPYEVGVSWGGFGAWEARRLTSWVVRGGGDVEAVEAENACYTNADCGDKLLVNLPSFNGGVNKAGVQKKLVQYKKKKIKIYKAQNSQSSQSKNNK